jgi:hypothetical protein
MAISELKLPASVKAHALADSNSLAATLAHDVAERLRQAIASKGQACVVCPAAAARCRSSSTWPSKRWTGRR